MNPKQLVSYKARGFTLIEMTVVICVLITLMSTGLYFSSKISDWQAGKEAAEQLLRGKTPREIYDIVRERCSQAPGASINDFFETLDWVIKEGYATEAELEAVEEENG